MQAAATFHDRHGHAPRSRAGDPEEARLGRFMRTWRYAASHLGPGWSAERQAYADETYPQWKGLGVPPMSVLNPELDARFRARARDLARFIDTYDRLPVKGAADPWERSLSGWLGAWRMAERARNRGWTAARSRYLDEVVPRWAEGRVPSWRQRAAQCAAFEDQRGRPPSRHARDATEAALGRWRERVRAVAGTGAGRWSGDRVAELDRIYPAWRVGGRRRTSADHGS